jgi:hypothetical protein
MFEVLFSSGHKPCNHVKFCMFSRYIFLLVGCDIPFDIFPMTLLFNPFLYPFLVPNACVLLEMQFYSVLNLGTTFVAYYRGMF